MLDREDETMAFAAEPACIRKERKLAGPGHPRILIGGSTARYGSRQHYRKIPHLDRDVAKHIIPELNGEYWPRCVATYFLFPVPHPYAL